MPQKFKNLTALELASWSAEGALLTALGAYKKENGSYPEAILPKEGKSAPLEISLMVNGTELPFTAIIEAMSISRRAEIETRARALLDERLKGMSTEPLLEMANELEDLRKMVRREIRLAGRKLFPEADHREEDEEP